MLFFPLQSYNILFHLQRDYLKVAQQYFQLVGGSASECGKLKIIFISSTSEEFFHNIF